MQGVIFRSLLGLSKRPGLVSTFPAYIALLGLTAASAAVAQSVVPDGGSATSVTISGSGQITVGIAPADASSISHNTYSDFSVPASGVNLDNSVVAAGTILNEVTSAKITTIEGDLKVVGSAADVIVANPNGITVNGGRFVNTRNLALTTGALGRDASGHITATVDTGEIVVGAGGLSGTMEELALISRSLKLDGPVTHDAINSNSMVNIIAGDSTVNFDPARFGGGILPWALPIDPGTKTSNAVLVDITNNGSLSSGRIRVAVTDAGAGVRFAGDQLASAGEFRLSNDGRVEINDARINASGSINIKATSAKLNSSDTKRTEIVSDDSGVVIEIDTGDLELGSAKLSGKTIASNNLASSGGVTLLVDGEITSQSSSDGQSAELSSSDSNVVATAGVGIDFVGLSVETPEDFRLGSTNSISIADAIGTIGEDFSVLATGDLRFASTKFDVESDIRLDAASLQFGTQNRREKRTELVAETGGFVAKTTSGDILNFGSLLQGKTASIGDPDSLGGLTLNAAGGIVNESLSVDRLAVAFGQSDDLHITAVEDIENKTGRFFSNAAITITTAGDILNETAFVGEVLPYTVTRFKGGRFASSLFLKRSKKLNAFANFGRQAVSGEQSFILGVGNIKLSAANVRNVGADITGAVVDIDATGQFTNESRQTGFLYFSQSCKFFCKTSGYSDIRAIGGNITASNQVMIDAQQAVSSVAGRIEGARGVLIKSPITRFIPLLTATFIDQQSGAGSLFGGRGGLLSSRYQFGVLRAPAGKITIEGDVEFGETSVFSSQEIEVTGNQIRSRQLPDQIVIGRQPIGFFWNLF